ncbi:mitochondrial substrate carrier family protein [Actinidia rufa]|uniref:Mitochondrial substrate carrier family protein n=1 Tax=Actinidia rufa TaxID=165716 RepID=A0A7J0E7N3_9ERIC|nr:mitochondrial substrate carrier family protein [Actinidia rufa]
MATTTTTTTEFFPEISVSPPSHDGLEFWQFMVAGSIAGSVEHMAMFPIDTLKTRMQAIGSSSLPSSAALTLRQSLGSILKLEGAAGLYRGIAAMGLGAGPSHAVYFSVYELFKGFSRRRTRTTPPLTRRLGTTVVMNAPFTAVHFATYEAAKKGLMEVSPERVGEDETLVVHATAGAAAGALASALTTPLDVVKTQLQCQGVCGCDRFSSCSIQDVIQTIVKKDGYGGLMRGWIPRMLFHAPAAAICWSTYEAAKTFFQEINGSDNSID